MKQRREAVLYVEILRLGTQSESDQSLSLSSRREAFREGEVIFVEEISVTGLFDS